MTERLLIRIEADATWHTMPLDLRLLRYRITGLTAAGDALLATAVDRTDGTRLAIAISPAGAVEQAWLIGGEPTGVAVLGMSEHGPTLLTSNRGPEPTITQYEVPTPPGDLDAPAAELFGEFSLDMAPQPSGISYRPSSGGFVIITDFGRVASVGVDGGDSRTLFDIPSGQGSYESIGVDSGDNLVLIASDTSRATERQLYDDTGVLLASADLEVATPDSVVEAYAEDGIVSWWVSADADGRQTLYRSELPASATSVSLPDEYDSLPITGLAVNNGVAIFVTDQRQTEDGVRSGLFLVWDLLDNVELARYAIAAPDASGNLQGVLAPSGVAIDPDTGAVYVTSDTDEGNVFVFDLELDDD